MRAVVDTSGRQGGEFFPLQLLATDGPFPCEQAASS